MKVSVIIPVYNAERFLAGCLKSVLAQTLRDIEVVCVDDGSTDSSAELLADFAGRDARVRVITHMNFGPGPARNTGIEAATGQFIAFMDCDDRYPDDTTLERMYDEAVSSGALVCGGGIEIRSKDGAVEKTFSGRFEGNSFSSSSMTAYSDWQYDLAFYRFIYSRELIASHNLRFPALRYYEDPPFFVHAMDAAGRFMALPFVTYRANVEEKSLDWFSGGCRKVLDLLEGIRMNLEFAKEKGYRQLREYSCLSVDWTYCWVIRRALRLEPAVRKALDAVEAVSGYPSRPTELEAEWDGQRVKIFMVYHKPSPFLAAEPFVPIQVGAGIDIPDVVCRDNTMDNIAEKNPNFCELTAQYWIWKNVRADYVGLMHYRRLISFTGCGEWTFLDFSDKTCERFGWNAGRIDALLRDYDILLPPDDTVFPPGERGNVMTPYEFHCREHRKCDIDAAIAAIHDLTPEYDRYAQKALCEDTHECFGNICVMRKDLFDSYSEWLFKILFEVERRIEIPENREDARLFGFLSERLVMVWLGFAREKLGARVWNAPSMPFGDFPENIHPKLSVRPHDAVAEPMVSVIIPVYNVEPYLPMCLNSVCGQCLDEIEIICVDDGSTDGSAAVLGAAAQVDRRIKVIKGAHDGPGAARNRGLAEARGKYIAFVDSDDWVDRFIWFRTVRKAERDNLDMVLFEVEKVDDSTGERTPDYYSQLKFADADDGVYHEVFSWRDSVQDVFNACCYPVNRLVRRKLWKGKRFPEDVVMGEDMLPHVQLTLEAERIGFQSNVYYHYRQRPGSSMTLRGPRALDHLKNADAVVAYLRESGRMAEVAELWPHFVFAMVNWAYVYWPTRECFVRMAEWAAPLRATLLKGNCFGLRLLVRILGTGNYPLFSVVFRALFIYRTSKNWLRAHIHGIFHKLRRKIVALFSRHERTFK